MRIISGQFRGKKIHPPVFFKDRPTTDYAKESLFNIITNLIEFENVNVLDLFAGSGNISYEFASRGCREIVSVENNFRYCGFINQMKENLKLHQVRVIKTDVFDFLRRKPGRFDIVFADPPYRLGKLIELPDLVIQNSLLKPEGLFFLEHGKENNFSCHPAFREERVYGAVHFSIFRNINNTLIFQ